MRITAGGTLTILLWGCGTEAPPPPPAAAAFATPTFQAISFLGDSLYSPPQSDSVRQARVARLAVAHAAYFRDTLDLDSLIWYGRRTAYLGRFREAADLYTRGLARHPDDPRLLRHRGHRHITLRLVDSAETDLMRAARAVGSRPDEIEPDGEPNARNEPRSTLQGNIWYHLGLARYLRGDFERATVAFLRARRLAQNDDMLVASVYWQYLASSRAALGAEDELLRAIRPGMDVIENHTYYRLLRLYAGQLPVDSLLDPSRIEGLDNVTAAYGVAAWHLIHGRATEGTAILQRILTVRDQWPAFGYIAAEADLARARAAGRREVWRPRSGL